MILLRRDASVSLRPVGPEFTSGLSDGGATLS
jgi:hypothetical protein